MTPRKILHLDLDAFFCAVEEQRTPTLRGIAFAVGGRPDQRGVVSSCSYAARAFGVHSAMPMSQAVRLCPHLVVVPPNFGAYRAASEKVMERLNNLTPFVEQISIDEAFLDVTLLPQEAETLARRLQTQINDELRLPCSLGVATSKLVAKIANNLGKTQAKREGSPNAILVVPPGQEAAFLAPLPVIELWGVGPKTAKQLEALGIHTIGQLAAWPADDLTRRFGKHGSELAMRSKGLDNRPVEVEGETKSVSKETTFTNDMSDEQTLKRTLRQLAEGVGRRLRQDGLRGTTIKLKLRWADFSTLSRQTTLDQPTNHDAEIYEVANQLFDKTWQRGQPVRLIGVGVSGFEDSERQLNLWGEEAADENRRLESALDKLRDRFGDKAIRRGSDLLDEN